MAVTNDGNGASVVMVVRVAEGGEGRKEREVKKRKERIGEEEGGLAFLIFAHYRWITNK